MTEQAAADIERRRLEREQLRREIAELEQQLRDDESGYDGWLSEEDQYNA